MPDFDKHAEAAARAALNVRLRDMRERTLERLLHMKRSSEADLKPYGYATKLQAYEDILLRFENDQERMISTHEKQFPD